MKSGNWQDLATTDFGAVDAETTIALFPVSAVEQHGPHLPLSTDAEIADGIVRAALDGLPSPPTVLVLPGFVVGDSVEHTSFPGTLSIDAATLAAAWFDIGRSVARAGIRKLVIFNSHGGQKALVDLAAMRLRAELAMLVVRASYFSFGMPEGLFDEREILHGVHGGEIETSLMLHLRADLVRRDALDRFSGLPEALADRNVVLGAEKPAGFAWMSEDLHPEGVCGDAASADAERGGRYLDYLGERLRTLLVELAETPLGIIDKG